MNSIKNSILPALKVGMIGFTDAFLNMFIELLSHIAEPNFHELMERLPKLAHFLSLASALSSFYSEFRIS